MTTVGWARRSGAQGFRVLPVSGGSLAFSVSSVGRVKEVSSVGPPSACAPSRGLWTDGSPRLSSSPSVGTVCKV